MLESQPEFEDSAGNGNRFPDYLRDRRPGYPLLDFTGAGVEHQVITGSYPGSKGIGFINPAVHPYHRLIQVGRTGCFMFQYIKTTHETHCDIGHCCTHCEFIIPSKFDRLSRSSRPFQITIAVSQTGMAGVEKLHKLFLTNLYLFRIFSINKCVTKESNP